MSKAQKASPRKSPRLRKPPKTTFKPGNELWKRRKTHGAPPIFETGEDLWNAALGYFQWNAENPIKEVKVFHHRGRITEHTVDKVRVMTLGALFIYLDIHQSTWKAWRTNPRLAHTVAKIESIIRTHKIEAAAADLVNGAFIARLMGLKDPEEQGGGGSTVVVLPPKDSIDD